MASRLVHEQSPEVVTLVHHVQPASRHRCTGKFTDPTGHHARRHTLGMTIHDVESEP